MDKTAYGAKPMSKQKTISNSNFISILGILVTDSRILGTTENAAFAHFMKKAMHLKTGFLSVYQVLFLLLNGPTNRNKFEVKSIDFDTSILPFTSTTGQSVAQISQKIF